MSGGPRKEPGIVGADIGFEDGPAAIVLLEIGPQGRPVPAVVRVTGLFQVDGAAIGMEDCGGEIGEVALKLQRAYVETEGIPAWASAAERATARIST